MPLDDLAPVAPPALARTMHELVAQLVRARSTPVSTLGQSLLDLKLVDLTKLKQITLNPSEGKRGCEHVLLDAGLVTELELEHARAHILSTPEVDALNFQVEPAALEHLPWATAFKHHVLPLGINSGVLYAASPTPLKRGDWSWKTMHSHYRERVQRAGPIASSA